VTPLTVDQQFNVRLDLYYIDNGAAFDVKYPIYGAHADLLNVESTKTQYSQFPQFFSFAQDASTGKLSFYGWQGTSSIPISNFTRLATVGATGTTTFNCGPNTYTVDGLCSHSAPSASTDMALSVPYELVLREKIAKLSQGATSTTAAAYNKAKTAANLKITSTSWTTDCTAGTGGKYYKSNVTFASGLVKLAKTNYTDSACSTSYSREWFAAHYDIGANISGSTTAYEMDLKVVSITLTPLSSTAANDFTTASKCGLTGWVANTGLDTFGKDCGDGELLNRDDSYYVSLKVSSNKLYLYDENASAGGTTAADRITTQASLVFNKD
jgi:hypothetical protein